MKTKVRSIFVAVVILSVLIFANMQALAETKEITLDTQIECVEGLNQYTFTPAETGIYTLKTESVDMNKLADMTVSAGKYIYYGMEVAETTKTVDDKIVLYYYNHQKYLLFAGQEYVVDVQAMTDEDMFVVSVEQFPCLGEIKAGEKIDVNMRGYLVFKPDKNLQVQIDGCGRIFAVQSFSEIQPTEKVETGTEYWILTDVGKYVSDYTQIDYIPDADNTTVTTSNIEDMQSDHLYANNLDKSWVYTAPEGTVYNDITFSEHTVLDSFDKICIYDGNGTEVGVYYGGRDLRGETLPLVGTVFTIRLVSDVSISGYGFALTEIKSYTSVPAPVADIESGTIRPNDLNLTVDTDLAQIYYRTGDNEEYILYDSAIPLTKSCTVYAYAKIGENVSETVTYTYIVDTNELEAPTIVSEQYSDGVEYITATVPEGTVYYKKLFSHSQYYVLQAGNKIRMDGNDVIAAYAVSGNLTSKTVYYKGRWVEDTEDRELEAPAIKISNVLGGKKITIEIPQSITLKKTNNLSYNYCEDHYTEICGDEGYKHNLDEDWWTLNEGCQAVIKIGKASATPTTERITSNLDEKDYTITENTAVQAYINDWYEKLIGDWMVEKSIYYIEHIASSNGGGENNYDYYSPTIYEYIEVPTAEKPYIRIVGNEVQMTAEDGVLIYYSVNGSDYTEYTAPFNAVGGDRIKAYAIGMGIAKSEISEKAVPVTGRFGIVLDNDLTVNDSNAIENLEIQLISNAALDKTYKLIAAVFDNESKAFCDVKMKTVTLAGKATTTVNDIVLSVEDTNADPCVKIFLWDISEPMSAMTQKKTCFVQ